jgi:hypothetical protein
MRCQSRRSCLLCAATSSSGRGHLEMFTMDSVVLSYPRKTAGPLCRYKGEFLAHEHI